MTNAEAVREEWRGPVESMSQVLAQMRRVRSAVAREEGPALDHIRPRNSVLNLVVVAREWSGAEEAAATIARLAAGHPCRAIFLVDEPESKRTHIEARVAVQARPLAAGMMCEYEQVFLRVEGPTANHIPSLVEPLLEGDLRTVLWWIGSPPIGTRRFAEAADVGEYLLVDSARFERPYEQVVQLVALARGRRPRLWLGDFQWARLQPWRVGLAQFFNPAERRGFLQGIGAVGLDYVGEGRGNRTGVALLAGWLAGALNWKLTRAVGGRGGVVVAHFEARGGQRVELQTRPVSLEGQAQGDIAAVRIDAVWNSQTLSLVKRRDAERPDCVLTEGTLGGRELPRRLVPLGSADNAVLLAELVAAGKDEVYTGALERAGELLEALR